MRRSIFILATLIVLAGVAVAVYFYFFASKAALIVAPESTTLPIAGDTTSGGGDASATTTSVVGQAGTPARLVQISKGPVVPGVVATDVRATASTSADVLVSYIERQSGNVFRYSTRAGSITRTSNRTVPGIQSAAWLPSGATAFVQYLSGTDSKTINSYALHANGASGFFLPQNLSGIAVASTSLLVLATGVNGSVASIERTDGTNTLTLFTTALSALRVSFAGPSRYLAFTKPTATLPGTAFLVDKKGSFSRLIGPLPGLVALASPLGKWVLVSFVQNGSMQLRLVDTATNQALPLPIATIADKCVWASDDSAIYCGVPVGPSSSYAYPDDWYQGAVRFSDRMWKVDVAGRFAQLVLDFNTETKSSLDATALSLNPSGSTLIFLNKNDASLWSYRL
ncbi:MAG: hypothetical protein WC030_01645 [Candidatus Paceibacterota bacterium]